MPVFARGCVSQMTTRPIQERHGTADMATGRRGSRRNRLVLRDHLRSVDIGAFESERGKPQRVLFNVAVTLEDGTFDQDADVDRVLSYDMIVEAIEEVLAKGRSDLLESVAERIAAVLFRDVRVMVAEIRIEKLDRVPGALGVEIVRSRAPEAPHSLPETGWLFPVTPTVIFVPDNVLRSDLLPAWINFIRALNTASVICVDKREDHGPVAGDPDAGQRIELLSIEQNAWYLSSCDNAFGVVATLAELKARTGENRISVWAPARIVLGSEDGTGLLKSENPLALVLAIWLARSIGARRLVACGCRDDLPGTCDAGEGGVQIDFALTPDDL